ncbi:hypothetical protein ACFSMW_02155 [Virgibacillus halophilus]|uniref:Membrane protein YizD n=1 Tax=Tigheibacillus halophilus TaxID=361280 RepID=A0ABU5CBZ3_9BACI|nr:hypothetical protein [Virgibacillus halophilus]
MKEFLPVLFLIIAIFAFVLNFLALIGLMPLYITLPLFFLAVYLTIFTSTHKNVYRGRIR